MIRAYDIEVYIVALERARAAALNCRMDASVISDIDHLISTARYHKEDNENNK